MRSANSEDEGVEFVWLSAPEAFLGDGKVVSGVRAQRMRLGAPDATWAADAASRSPDSQLTASPADLVITALGFDPEDRTGAVRRRRSWR